MAEKNETNNVEENEQESYVTRSELENILETKLESIVSGFLGDTVTDGNDADWEETTDKIDDVAGHMSPSQIEKLMEQKVQEALAGLTAKKETRAPAKKATTTKKVEAPKPEPEEAPTAPGKLSLSQKLWGTK